MNFEIKGDKYEGTLGEYVSAIIEQFMKDYPKADINDYHETFDGPKGRTPIREENEPQYFNNKDNFYERPMFIHGKKYYISKIHSIAHNEDIDVFEEAIDRSSWRCQIRRYDSNGLTAFDNK